MPGNVARRSACFLGLGGMARACTGRRVGSARWVECRISAPFLTVGVRFPSSSLVVGTAASGAVVRSVRGRRGALA